MSTSAPWRRFATAGLCAASAALTGLVVAPAAQADTGQQALVNYDDFSSIQGLHLFGDAHQSGNRVRLTDAINSETGVVWADRNLDPAQDFSTDFTLDLHDASGCAADGIDFVMQNAPAGNQAQGGTGGAMGYAGIRPSFAAEFDIFGQNEGDPSDNHVGFLTDGNSNNAANPASWTSSAVPQLYGNGPIHAWLDYTATSHQVRLYVSSGAAKPSSPTLDIVRDLSAEVGTHSAFIGFTAATGGCNAVQDVLSWHVSAVAGATDHVAPATTDDVPTSASAPATAPVPVTLTATDDAGGTGVKEIRYTIGDTTHPAADPTAPDGNPRIYDSSHKPTLLDGQLINYSAIDNAGNFESPHASSAAQVTSTVSKPVLNGAAKVGQTITASGVVTTPSDATTSYQWYSVASDGTRTDIAGATGPTYQLVAADAGSEVGVVVVATATGYQSSTNDSGPSATISRADESAPTTRDDVPTDLVTTPVTVTLTATDGDGSGVAGIRYIVGTPATPGDPTSAAGADYSESAKPVLYDGQVITYAATDDAGNAETPHSSSPAMVTATVETPGLNRDRVGQTIMPFNTGFTPTTATPSYQWYRVTSDGTRTDIAGATEHDYTITEDDLGAQVGVVFTATAPGYRTATSDSGLTSVITYDDSTAPTTTDNVPTGTFTAPVTVTLTAKDGSGSGVSGIRYAIGTASAPGDPNSAAGAAYDATAKPVLYNGQVISYSATDKAGNQEVTKTSAPAKVAATVTKPTLGKNAKVGQTVTTSGVVVTPTGATIAYQWYRLTGGTRTVIDGATGSSYLLTGTDAGSKVGVVVTVSATGYRSATIDSGPSAVITVSDKVAPVTTDDVPSDVVATPVTVTLNATDNDGGSGVAATRYAIGTSDTPGKPYGSAGKAYDPAHKPVLLDGQVISYSSTDRDGNRETTKSSAPAQVTTTVATPTIQGDPTVGAQLQAAATPVTPTDATVAYQWIRAKADGRSPMPIDGATAPTYTLVAADKGMTILVTATTSAPGYRSASATSAPTAVIGTGTSTGGFTVNADGGDQVGETRVAHTSLDTDPAYTLTYQWQQADNMGNFLNLPGAAAKKAAFELPVAVEGINVRVLVTATRRGYTPRQVGSAPLVIRAGAIMAHDPVISGTVRAGQTVTASVTVDNTNIANLKAVYTWTVYGPNGYTDTYTGQAFKLPKKATSVFFDVALSAPGYNNNSLRSGTKTVGP